MAEKKSLPSWKWSFSSEIEDASYVARYVATRAFDFATRWNITGEFVSVWGNQIMFPCFEILVSPSSCKMRGNKDFKTYAFFPQKDWPRQDSNLQSPVPKSNALSIRPHGLIPVECSSLTHRKYIKQMGLQYTEDSLMERLASRWLWERWPCLFFLGNGVSHQEL